MRCQRERTRRQLIPERVEERDGVSVGRRIDRDPRLLAVRVSDRRDIPHHARSTAMHASPPTANSVATSARVIQAWPSWPHPRPHEFLILNSLAVREYPLM